MSAPDGCTAEEVTRAPGGNGTRAVGNPGTSVSAALSCPEGAGAPSVPAPDDPGPVVAGAPGAPVPGDVDGAAADVSVPVAVAAGSAEDPPQAPSASGTARANPDTRRVPRRYLMPFLPSSRW
ncbi:MAG: hypothetical protein P8Z68_03910 [Kineosporiaceae bacterium]